MDGGWKSVDPQRLETLQLRSWPQQRSFLRRTPAALPPHSRCATAAPAHLVLAPHSKVQYEINVLQFIAVAAAAISLAACGGGGASDAPPATPPASGPVTVEILGDSIALGIVEFASPVMRMRQQRPSSQLVDQSSGGLQFDTMITGYTEP